MLSDPTPEDKLWRGGADLTNSSWHALPQALTASVAGDLTGLLLPLEAGLVKSVPSESRLIPSAGAAGGGAWVCGWVSV